MAVKEDQDQANLPVVNKGIVGPPPIPVGRPRIYNPAMCEEVERLGALGWSKVEIASHFNVDRRTIDDWIGSYPEFDLSMIKARENAQAWWERAGREGMYADKFNAAVWKKTVESRFRDDYTERRVTEVVNSDDLGTAFKRKFDLSLLQPEQREQLKSLLMLCYRGDEQDGRS